ncbi:MAG: bis(5'-nucleosyl)-tetraphosphatase (symmetrical) YqeK [Enterococcus sp.]
MKYSQENIQITRQELMAKVQMQMSPRRFQHVLGVEACAIELATLYGASLELASIAALCHDYAKERSDETFITWINEQQLPLELLNWGNAVWHGIVGAEIIKQELLVTNEAVLNAIRVHTTGAAEMSLLDKILYVADYIEPNRDFVGVEKARQLAYQNLDAAVAYETEQTLVHLLAKKAPIYPKTIETYNKWVAHQSY